MTIPNKQTSHDYADSLNRLAEFIKSKPSFEIDKTDVPAFFRLHLWYEKDLFLGAVKALGSGKKEVKNEYGEDEIMFVSTAPTGEKVELVIKRNQICRLIRPARPAEYDCEPLLSQYEESALEAE